MSYVYRNGQEVRREAIIANERAAWENFLSTTSLQFRMLAEYNERNPYPDDNGTYITYYDDDIGDFVRNRLDLSSLVENRFSIGRWLDRLFGLNK